MRVYLAAPFFSDEQVTRVQAVEAALNQNESVDYFYSPRLHQETTSEQFSPEWAKEVFERDVNEVLKADVLVTIADYVADDADSGTAFEQGMAYALKKPVVMFEETNYKTNLMLTESLTTFITDPNDLEKLDFNDLPQNQFEGERL